MEYFGLILVLFVCLVRQNEGKRNWQIVSNPAALQPINIDSSEQQEPQMTYNDEKTRMTAIHDLDYNACFLTNYDPEWSLNDEEKRKLSNSLVGQTIESSIEFLKFRMKVGEVISSICKKRKIYWMTRPELPPKPQKRAPVRLQNPLAPHLMDRPEVPPRPLGTHNARGDNMMAPPPMHIGPIPDRPLFN